MNKIAILDFGSQYAHLIATRIRRQGVYSEILDPSSVKAADLKDYKGIIFSGGPSSVYEEGSPTVDPEVFKLGLPILGICYGHQLITHLLGGKVEPGQGQGREFGKAQITIQKNTGLFSSFAADEKTQVWMSHGDRVTQLPEGFEILASSADDKYSAVGDTTRNFYGLQFHPEVTHSTRGSEIYSNFLNLCGIERDWNLGNFVDHSMEAIKNQVGDRNVFMLISGGVDSTVAFVLLVKALGQDRVYGLFVDTGFMRAGEIEEVKAALNSHNITNFHIEDAKSIFYEALGGAIDPSDGEKKPVIDPEMKRHVIGDKFLEVQAAVARKLDLNPEKWILGQGTIYPDTIESGGTKNSVKIKTHHNRVPEIEELIKQGKVIEPLKDLYKDEVREVGEKLGLPKHLVWRHPFPGPGLAVRILCVDPHPSAMNTGPTGAQAIHSETDRRPIEENIKDFLVEKNCNLLPKLLPIKSVGVQGDFRTYKNAVVLCGEANWEDLRDLSPAITNKFPDINRVLYLVEPAKIESVCLSSDREGRVDEGQSFGDYIKQESRRDRVYSLTPERVQLLQKADKLAMDWLEKVDSNRTVWQMPTVLIPVSINSEAKESIVLRPIVSEEAMTAHFAELPMDKVRELARELLQDTHISAVLYDVTNKPPATIEWE